MNGAQALINSLLANGVELGFTNPGTSEMHFVSALDGAPDFRAILCLFEGVATGAADGYGRMARKPASTLLHLGAGLSNGMANLHNARRAATPLVNIIGDHATYHSQYDAPLTSDIRALLAPLRGWVRQSASAMDVAGDGARAVQASYGFQNGCGQIASLILPANVAWLEAGESAQKLEPIKAPPPSARVIDKAVAMLKNGKKTALLLRHHALSERGLLAAGRIAAKTNARLLCDTFPPRLTRGAGIVEIERVPYFAEQAQEFLSDSEQMILVATKPPISFFAYPDKASWLSPKQCQFFCLAQEHEDSLLALEAVADGLNAPSQALAIAPLEPYDGGDKFNQWSIGAVICEYLKRDMIMIDDAATSGLGSFMATAHAPRHDYLALTGGAIGIGLPLSIGAAIACPKRKIIALSGDGSAMYNIQALWTQAREQLDIVNIIFNNRSYAILNIELERVGAQIGKSSSSLLNLDKPVIDWVHLSESLGVPAIRASNVQDFSNALKQALSGKGPKLIEAVID